MAVPRNSLRVFLTQAKNALRSAISSNQKVTLVIGNESADLDSMTSQILYAYVRSMAPSKNAFTGLYIPITNMPAAGISSRPEFLAVFKHADIEPGHLITLDDLPALADIQVKLKPENTRWILVDHNALQGQLGSIYSHRVQGVIDHHDDEGAVPSDTGDEPRVIEKSGSCTSLVTNYVQPVWDTQDDSVVDDDDDAAVKRWDASIAQLSLASVLIDTANLQDKSKTTAHDLAAVEFLEAKITSYPPLATSFNRTAFYNAIDAAKRDIDSLSLQDILAKDYKQWTQHDGQTLGISSVVKPLSFLLAKAGDESGGAFSSSSTNSSNSSSEALLTQLHSFAHTRNLDLYSIMTTSTSADGDFQRELLLWAFSDRAAAWARSFAAESREELGLVDWDGDAAVARGGGGGGGDGNGGSDGDGEGGGDTHWRRVWWQRQVQHSRKRVAPLLRQACP